MKVDTITYHVITWSDFDSFVSEHYGQKYDFVSVVESSNDVDHSFSVDGKVSEYDNKDLNEWIETGSGRVWPNIILDDLASKCVIPAGNYLIKVSW